MLFHKILPGGIEPLKRIRVNKLKTRDMKSIFGILILLFCSISSAQNLIDWSSWVIGSSTEPTGFEYYGSSSNNSIISDVGPYGTNVTMLKGVPGSGVGDGGVDVIPSLDVSEVYRISTWVKSEGTGGCTNYFSVDQWNRTHTIAGGSDWPEFRNSNLPDDKWLLVVAYIRPNGSNTAYSEGVYDPTTIDSNNPNVLPNPILTAINHNFINTTGFSDVKMGPHLYNCSSGVGEAIYVYDIRVEPINGQEPSILELLAGPDSQVPTAPAVSSSTKTETTVDLSWTAATDNIAVTGYKVYKDAVLESTLGNVLSYEVTGLTANTAYNFTVTALDAAGNESVVSNTLAITTDGLSANIFLESNAANSDNDGDTIGSCTGVNVDVTSVSNGDGTYKIRATANTTGTGRLIFYIPASTTGPHELRWTASESSGADGRTAQGKNSDGYGTYLLFTPRPSFTTTPTEYVSTLTNLDGTGFTIELFMYSMTVGDYIDIDNLSIIPIVDTQAPTAPTLSSSTKTETTVDLSWTAATDNTAVTGYKVYKDAVLESTLGNVLNYQVTELTASTAYNFTVTALDAAGNESVVSNTLAITTDTSSGGGSGYWSLNNQDVYYSTGKVGIGTSTPDEALAVNGNIHAKEVRVDLQGWPDYVFTDTYKLPSLKEVENHIKTKGYLPNMPSAKDVETNGVELGEMNKKLLEKIEELTLYIIQQQEEISSQSRENKDLKSHLEALEQKIKDIKE